MQILLTFYCLSFIISFIENIDAVSDIDNGGFLSIKISLLQAPQFLNEIIIPIILFSGIATYHTISSKSEITVMKNCGLSLWHTINPIGFSVFFIGIIWIFVINPISIKMMNEAVYLESNYIKKEKDLFVESKNGIWFKQENPNNRSEIIIFRAKKLYKENLIFNNVAIWYFNKDGKFYKKIDAKTMELKNNFWNLSDIIINDMKSINSSKKNMLLQSLITEDFVKNKMFYNLQDPNMFSIFELPEIINSLFSAGFDVTRFKVYYYNLILKPILFFGMILLSCYFGVSHVRSGKSFIMIFLGIICGLCIHVLISFSSALASSRVIPVYSGTFILASVFVCIGILFINKKEHS